MDPYWLTREEAGEILGIIPGSVSSLYRDGRLATRLRWPILHGWRSGYEMLYLASEIRGVRRIWRRRRRLDIKPEDICARCTCILAENTPSPHDPTLCDDCWDMLHPQPKEARIAVPRELLHPAFLERG